MFSPSSAIPCSAALPLPSHTLHTSPEPAKPRDTMSIGFYSIAGTIFFGLGVLVCLSAAILFIASGMGLSALPRAHLNLHDTYYIIYKPTYRLAQLALPLTAGILLMISGRFMKQSSRSIQAQADEAAASFRTGESSLSSPEGPE